MLTVSGAGKWNVVAFAYFSKFLIFIYIFKYWALSLWQVSPCVVKGNLVGKKVTQVACGDGFTVAATSENQVFSWGLGENGRLGINPSFLSGKSCSAVPKAIFGSLHKVASLKCRHWHTIILGERVHGSRVIQKSSSIPDSMMSSMESGEHCISRTLFLDMFLGANARLWVLAPSDMQDHLYGMI